MQGVGSRKGNGIVCLVVFPTAYSLLPTSYSLPVPSLDEQLLADLSERDAASLRRRLSAVPSGGRLIRVGGRDLLNLSGNDYLALSDHPRLKAAAIDAIERSGTGSGSSRLVTGTLEWHEKVEAEFAVFKHAPAALILPTGYMANLAVLTALARRGDLICIDKLCHASLIDAAYASGATVRVYPHGDMGKLERLLSRANLRHENTPLSTPHAPRRFIVTDSVFSMDGDAADLPALCDLAQCYDATTIVDEAHGTGVLGDGGTGLCEAQGVTERVDVVVSTASKALGGLGGIVTASQAVIDTLVNRARSLIYTTAVPPAQVAAIGEAVRVVRDEPWRRQRLAELAERLSVALSDTGLLPPAKTQGINRVTPIFPLMTGTSQAALTLAQRLREQGVMAVAIRPPTVPKGAARVRLSLRADLTDDDLARVIAAIRQG